MSTVPDEINSILTEPWQPRTGRVVPQVDAVDLTNDTVQIYAAVLFSDLARSTVLVRDHLPQFAAHVIRVFLTTCSRSIRHLGGEIRSFDGDRVMAVFTGDGCAENATRAALLLNRLLQTEAIPRIKARWNITSGYEIAYGCGVDVGQIHVIRAGIRKYNDLVFLGMPTINATKLAQERIPALPVTISRQVYSEIQSTNLLATTIGQAVWKPRFSPAIKTLAYGSSCWLEF